MNKPAEQAIMGMLNVFPQTNQDYAVLLRTLSALLDGITDQAIIDAAKRFAAGEVEGQSDRFAPAGPEFVKEAKRRQELLDVMSRPRIQRSHPFRSYDFQHRLDGLRAAHAHRQILKENVALDEAQRILRSRQFPEGSSYVAVLGTIYGPESISKNGAN